MATTCDILVTAILHKKDKSKEGYKHFVNFTSPLREITYHTGSHSVTCHSAEVTFLHLPQPKLELDSATLKGCKAELSGSYIPKIVTYLRKLTGSAVTGI